MANIKQPIPGARSQAQQPVQIRSPYLPNADPDLQRELLTMRQQIQALQATPASSSASSSAPSSSLSASSSSTLSKEQMDYIKKNLEAGGSHALNVSGLLKGF